MIKIIPRVFITGASGNIGKALVHELLADRYSIIALVRNKSKLPLTSKNLKIIEADISEINKFKKDLRSCDYVYHLAVYQNPLDFSDKEFYRVNVEGTKLILDVLVGSGIKKFIYNSTVMVFKPTGKIERDEKWQKMAIEKKNHYTDTKLQALEVITKYQQKVPITILYPSIVISQKDITNGIDQSRNWVSLFRNIVGGGVPGTVMCMLGDKDRVMNFILIDNLLNGMVNVLNKGKTGEDYILGGENITVGNYLHEVARIKQITLLPLRIPISFVKFISRLPVPGHKLLYSIANVPPVDMCFSSQKAVKNLGLKITKLESF